MRNSIPDEAEYFLDEYDAERFWSSVNRHGGTPYVGDLLATAKGECWLWSADTKTKNYGRFRLFDRWFQAHRIAYQDFGHKLSDDLELDHLCRIPQCVNPAHMEPVTHLENVQRGLAGNVEKCKQGHEYTAENTVWQKRKNRKVRWCRICMRASRRKSYLRRKDAA